MTLNDRESSVLSVVQPSATPLDYIIAKTKLKPAEVLATLLVLEVRHLLTQLPGKRWKKTQSGHIHEFVIDMSTGGKDLYRCNKCGIVEITKDTPVLYSVEFKSPRCPSCSCIIWEAAAVPCKVTPVKAKMARPIAKDTDSHLTVVFKSPEILAAEAKAKKSGKPSAFVSTLAEVKAVSAKKRKATPQVAPLAGMTPLGIKPAPVVEPANADLDAFIAENPLAPVAPTVTAPSTALPEWYLQDQQQKQRFLRALRAMDTAGAVLPGHGIPEPLKTQPVTMSLDEMRAHTDDKGPQWRESAGFTATAQPLTQSAPVAPVRTDLPAFTIRDGKREGFTEIIFNAKPAADILADLRNAGYHWSPKHKLWYGPSEDLPARFHAMEPAAVTPEKPLATAKPRATPSDISADLHAKISAFKATLGHAPDIDKLNGY